MAAGLDERRGVRGAVLPGGLRIQHPARQPEHQPPRTPVRQVQERVEVPLHHRPRVALEVAPLVLVDEPRGRYLRPGRNRPQLGALFLGQRPVEREELVVLVFAHACRFLSQWYDPAADSSDAELGQDYLRLSRGMYPPRSGFRWRLGSAPCALPRSVADRWPGGGLVIVPTGPGSVPSGGAERGQQSGEGADGGAEPMPPAQDITRARHPAVRRRVLIEMAQAPDHRGGLVPVLAVRAVCTRPVRASIASSSQSVWRTLPPAKGRRPSLAELGLRRS